MPFPLTLMSNSRIALLSGQPAWSGHLAISRGKWPLNTGLTEHSTPYVRLYSPSYNATHCRIHYAHFRHLFPGHHGSKQLLCKFRPYKRAVWSMRSVFFSRAFPGRGHWYLFSMSNEEQEPSNPTDQETRFSCWEAKLVALSSCFEALAHKFDVCVFWAGKVWKSRYRAG